MWCKASANEQQRTPLPSHPLDRNLSPVEKKNKEYIEGNIIECFSIVQKYMGGYQ